MQPESKVLTESPAADSLERLQQLSSLAAEAGALTLSADASQLATRTQEGLFYVTCVGQFKRGKSTLLNALVNEPVLPTGVVPVTSVVTILRHGLDRRARVRFSSGELRALDPLELPAYVSEEQNPENEKGVVAAEVFLPHPLFSTGLCLVDTPGLGSVFEANTETTRSFVPHIDAALVVLGADPPISGEELSLVEELSRSVPHLIFVLNKADRLSEAERRDARRFAERVLEKRLGRVVGPILEVAAAESLAAGHPTRQLSTLEEALETLASEAGADLISRAQDRGLERLGRRVSAVLEEQREALERPLEESERRVEELQRSVAEAQRSAGDLAYLFTAEQNRLSEAFTARKEEFLARAHPVSKKALEAAIASGMSRSALSGKAREIARRALEGWLPEIESVAERMYREAMRRFSQIVNQFFEGLAESDDAFAALPRESLDPETGFRARRRFYFNDLFELAPDSPGRFPLARLGARAVAAGTAEYLKTLLEHNATRVVNDLDERVLESRRRLEAEVSERLREGLDSAVVALDRARNRREAGRDAVDRELLRIASLDAKVRALVPPGAEETWTPKS
jgi:GTP-binding protein EngB required for normal cell division